MFEPFARDNPIKQRAATSKDLVCRSPATGVRYFLNHCDNVAARNFHYWPIAPATNQFSPNHGFSVTARPQLANMPHNKFVGYARKRISPLACFCAPLNLFLFFCNVPQSLQRSLSGRRKRHYGIGADGAPYELAGTAAHDNKCLLT